MTDSKGGASPKREPRSRPKHGGAEPKKPQQGDPAGDDWDQLSQRERRFAGPEVGLNLGPLSAKVAYDIPFGRDLDEGIILTTVGLGLQF